MQDLQNNNWERLNAVIRWAGMSINRFARHIGLSRGENLYQIRRGNNGISKSLALRIAEHFPEISAMWLLTGEGNMWMEEPLPERAIPYYRLDAAMTLDRLETLSPDRQLSLPLLVEADLAIGYAGGEMAPRIPAGSVLFLKEIDPKAIIPGADYVILSENMVYLRTIHTTDDTTRWRLEAEDRKRYDDWSVEKAAVRRAWLVVAHLVCH